MAEITISNLRHAYDGDLSDPSRLALKGIDHVWRDGGAYALLGPSGCGKSSMLNIISGLIRPTAGRVLFDGRNVTDLSPEQRNIAQVFQFPVLYDTMTVEQNLAFPLRNRGVDAATTARRVGEVAEMLDLTPMLKRRASGLGAADKQKISLGRGLVRKDVAAILFDEPLTVIDPQVKFDLRRKLKLVHETLRLTLVYVTHDQSEALTFADQVVVMSEGEVVQVGTPEELFERPAHTFVGTFIGSPGMNFLPCAIEEGRIAFDGGSVVAPRGLLAAAPRSGRFVLGLRPQAVAPAAAGVPGAIAAELVGVEDRGAFKIADIAIGANRLKMRVAEDESLPSGGFPVTFRPASTLLYADDRLVGISMHKIEDNRAWFLILPVFLLVAFNAVIPLMTVVNYSLQDIFGPGQRAFIGAEWFREMLRDETIQAAFWRQMLFSTLVLLIEIPLGVAIALTVPRVGWKSSAAIVLIAIPLLVPFNVVGTIWQVYARPEIGLFGRVINSLGIPFNYTADPISAWVTILLMDAWHWTPLVILLAFAGLCSIPEPYYQAARIDGASRWAVFRYIELPKLHGVLTIAILLRFMDSFMIYTEPYVVTGGGPGSSTTFLSIRLVNMAVGQFDLGPAAAFSLIYFLVILLFSYVFYTLLQRMNQA